MTSDKYSIDETGLSILEILENDSRISDEDIAGQLDLDVREVQTRIERYRKDGIIVRYTTHVNWERIRRDEIVHALIEVQLTPQRGTGFDAIAEAVYRFDEVRSVVLLSGSYDLLVSVEGPSLQYVALFVAEKLSVIEGVRSTVTHFRLRTYKENGQILVGSTHAKRIPFSF
ncbi:MAG: Lrp/AsnC family transcriptional regulator [Spirochaetota bacterium]